MIKGLFETHINVSSLERSMDFYGNTLGLPFASIDQDRRIAFYWIGERGKAMLGLWESPAEKIIQQHFAFRCDQQDIIQHATAYLEQRELSPYNFLKNGSREPMVFAWMPAIAIYFDDPDQHVLEFISFMNGEPKPELGIVSYETWLAQGA
ncbi:MAG: VOC family protein [Bacteroidota bacterium]